MIRYHELTAQARAEGIDTLDAAAVVLDPDGHVLLLDHPAGPCALPGGPLGPDEDPPTAAARHLHAATGLRGLDLGYLRTADSTGAGRPTTRHFAFAASLPARPAVTAPHRWAPLDELPDLAAHHRELLDHLRRRRTVPGWQPIGHHLRRIALTASYGAFYFTDRRGHPFQLRSAQDPDRWQLPGGDTDPGETPWRTALRETREELGLDPVADGFGTRRRLLAVLHHAPTTRWPLAKTGWIFDGGTLDDDQLHRIRLTAEHTDWAVDTLWRWRNRMRPQDHRRLMLVDRARRARTTLYAEHPDTGPDAFEGVLVLVTTPGRERVLLNLRDDHPGIAWPGHWAPIGGWREGHESAHDCAVREIHEEAGITVTALRPLPAPRHPLLADTTTVLHAVYDGPERALVLGEGQALRMVPREEVPALRTPPYLAHYLRHL
ncbi:NUDIX domain-containing protein [Kitasatospora sp. NPDC059646]|uniref:NUDIX hydrolase n=1 Tax=Kitasatospora sp. NPDC059646 TaxID=3346893 RepID=UPI0036BFBEA0